MPPGDLCNLAALKSLAARHTTDLPKVEWNFDQVHFCDDGPLTAQYLLVVDALNFCFWPGTVSQPEWCYQYNQF